MEVAADQSQEKSDKLGGGRRNYVIKFHLLPNEIFNPEVYRTLECPAEATFNQLHQALQVSFGWAAMRSFDFTIQDPSTPNPAAMGLPLYFIMSRIKDPAIGENGEDLKDTALRNDGVGFTDHAHPETLEKSANDVKLHELFENREYKSLSNPKLTILFWKTLLTKGTTYLADKQFKYTYDFRAYWIHEIIIEGKTKRSEKFRCKAGMGHPVADKSEGPHEWAMLKSAYQKKDSQLDPYDKQRKVIYERETPNGDSGGLRNKRVEYFDIDQINRDLADLAASFEKLEKTARDWCKFEKSLEGVSITVTTPANHKWLLRSMLCWKMGYHGGRSRRFT